MSDKYYRCYFIKDQHVVAVELFHCPDDSAAMLRASTLLNASQFLAIELWQEGRLVGQLSHPNEVGEQKQAS